MNTFFGPPYDDERCSVCDADLPEAGPMSDGTEPEWGGFCSEVCRDRGLLSLDDLRKRGFPSPREQQDLYWWHQQNQDDEWIRENS